VVLKRSGLRGRCPKIVKTAQLSKDEDTVWQYADSLHVGCVYDPVSLAILWMKSNQIDRRFSFRAIWSRKLQDLGPLAFVTVVVWLCSCDANLFGPESREIAGGYRLKRANNPNGFALTIPNEDGGLIIDEIGWREPLIFARAFGSQFWDVINTAHAQHIRVSDLQRKSDPISQSIQIKSAQIAWKELNRHKRLW
jgi:hypothetical protein